MGCLSEQLNGFRMGLDIQNRHIYKMVNGLTKLDYFAKIIG